MNIALVLLLSWSLLLSLRGGSASGLLRVVLPCWRFFQQPGAAFTLHYQSEGGPWQSLPAGYARSGLFLNAEGNLGLAYLDLVYNLSREVARLGPGRCPELAESSEYRLVANLVREQLGAGLLQFKICCDGEDVLISAWFEA